MFRTKSGEEIFIIDGHMHLWDASPENVLNKYGQGFIDCFYGADSFEISCKYAGCFLVFCFIYSHSDIHFSSFTDYFSIFSILFLICLSTTKSNSRNDFDFA